MQAIRVHTPGGPEAMRLEDVPVPTPAPGQAVVRLEAIGVNFIDVYHRTGLYKVDPPFTPGQEAAGTVTAVGDGVTNVAVGDRVAYTGLLGSYAQYNAVPANRLVQLPEGVASRDAAAVMLQGITAQYLATSTFPLQPGHVCIVHAAAGGVGLLLTQMAKMRGAMVIGTVSTAEKEALAREAGADHVVRYSEQDFQAAAREITGGRGVDVVYDGVGQATFDRSLGSLRRRGMMVSFGQSSGAVPPFDILTLNARGSLYLTRPSINAYITERPELEARASEVLGWVRDGKLKVRVGAAFPLAQAGDAHRALEGRQTTGKVLLTP